MVAGHPAKIRPECILWIGFDCFDESFKFLRLWYEPQEILDLIEGDAQHAAAIVRIAAAHLSCGAFSSTSTRSVPEVRAETLADSATLPAPTKITS